MKSITKMTILAMALLLSIACFSIPASAQTGAGLVTTMSDADVDQMLTAMGFEHEMIKPGAHRMQLAGYKVVLFNKDNALQLYAGFTVKPDCNTINEWNKGKRFSRAYIDNVGDAVIEADLNMDGGVAQANVEAFIRLFRISVQAFAGSLQSVAK